MRILAIETSSDWCSCALLVGDQLLVREAHTPQRHNEHVLPMIQALLAEAEVGVSGLTAIAFGAGPGSFIGVRIATSVAQGLGLAGEVGLAPISSLAAMAYHGWETHHQRNWLVAFDARRNEVYWGAYRCSKDVIAPIQIIAEEVSVPPQVSVPKASLWSGIGSGWDSFRSLLTARVADRLNTIIANQRPQAASIAALAVPVVASNTLLSPQEALPNYVRHRIATPSRRHSPCKAKA